MMTNATLSPLANDEELWFDADATENSLIFFRSPLSVIVAETVFSNFCMVRSKLKSFELSFGANSDSSA